MVASLAVAVAASGLIVAEAGAAEYVTNGGFDQGDCVPEGCVGPGWNQIRDIEYGAGTNDIGPICAQIVTNCASGTSGYTSYGNWARIAAGTGDTNPGLHAVQSGVSQVVSIPAAPATLSFNLHIVPGSPQVSFSYFSVRLDGRTLFAADSDEPGYSPNYARVAIDVSAFGGRSRVLDIIGTSSFGGTYSDSFDIDDVSITESPVAPVAPVAPAAPVVATGQQAAALQECKRKRKKLNWSKKRYNKCKRAAVKLPV